LYYLTSLFQYWLTLFLLIDFTQNDFFNFSSLTQHVNELVQCAIAVSKENIHWKSTYCTCYYYFFARKLLFSGSSDCTINVSLIMSHVQSSFFQTVQMKKPLVVYLTKIHMDRTPHNILEYRIKLLNIDYF